MDKKENILEAWVMVEHLSEGDIKLHDKYLKKIEVSENCDYYSMFYTEMQNAKLQDPQKSGIVLYFNVFPFKKVIILLREKYHFPETYEEISAGDKFSFALYFDKELKLAEEMTFFTASYYILQNGSIPKEKEFLDFEKENKEYINSIFACPDEEEYSEFFNKAFVKFLNKYSIQVEESRMKVLSNLETDATNLHSFFINDLKKAKSIKTRNLDAYLLGENKERINLNSKADDPSFNPSAFEDILQPRNYPMARFPSNTKHSLYLMQQIAVNLATGYDHEQIRSVNGPPGTGKSTLLKDIFAELIVEQAYEITKLTNKEIRKTDKLQYYKNAYIGVMPSSIADKGIVVASSNNGAVQNIIKNFSLISEIDKSFVDELRKADYFWEISNSELSTKWEEGENGKKVERLTATPYTEEKFWGLSSWEGGKKDNMEGIITALKHAFSHLDGKYVPKNEVYDNFLKRYQQLSEYKHERQAVADNVRLQRDLAKVENRINICVRNIEENAEEKNHVNQAIQALQLQKPSWFKIKARKEYKERIRPFSNQLLNLLEKEKALNSEHKDLQKEEIRIAETLKENEEKVKKKENEGIIRSGLNETKDPDKNLIQELNMHADYRSLQFSNPWFDEEYRILQSKLFIDALKVRKQFLYENRRSIKAAYTIWNKQKEYKENRQVIAEAWNWINMVIPVISSTFASFARMCANLGEESLGYLFVDEAGQALPQAGVGSIFRSKKVMVVGDPAQIKPVLSLDSSILSMIGTYYGVSNKYLSDSTSMQTLVDDISKYGFYKNTDEWIGIPLWVHRRCKNPMFKISNEISYGGNMVQNTGERGKACWYNVSGSASDKYVKEQGDFLKGKISELIKHNPDIIDKNKKDIVYVISPFRNVAFHLSKKLKEIGFTRYSADGKPTNVGTVHTFQGKEAALVFLVLGCDEKSRGAASWAIGSNNPNIMNVAVTRAKEEFYIIGDQKLFKNINSEVIDKTCLILEKFNGERNEQ